MIWKSLEGLRQMRRVFLDKCLEAKCREKPWKVRARTNDTYLAERKIALYRLSQILNYKTDGSLVNFRRKPFQSTQKTTEDVDNGHSKECRSFDVDLHCNTFKIRFRAVYEGPGRCMRDRTLTHSCQRRTPSIFLVREKGGGGVRPHPPNPPWLRACECEP